jgi:hypothetical protein
VGKVQYKAINMFLHKENALVLLRSVSYQQLELQNGKASQTEGKK